MKIKGGIFCNQKQCTSGPCPNAYLLALHSGMGVRHLPLVEVVACGKETCRPSVASACWPKPACRRCSGWNVYIKVSKLPPHVQATGSGEMSSSSVVMSSWRSCVGFWALLTALPMSFADDNRSLHTCRLCDYIAGCWLSHLKVSNHDLVSKWDFWVRAHIKQSKWSWAANVATAHGGQSN